ncbi:MAG: hypothetical protein K2L77_05580 [Muribaculaceae bacterium]|nr:hypothetical protein [Muribaculaceae bacterium]
MTKLLITCTLLFATAFTAISANPGNDSREEYVRSRACHFADKIGLDDATAEKFVKLFIENQREKWTLQPDRTTRKKQSYKTDAQIDSAINAQFKTSQKILDIRKKYYKEYRKLMTAKQVQMLYDEEAMMNVRIRGTNKKLSRKKAESTRKKAEARRKAAKAKRTSASGSKK